MPGVAASSSRVQAICSIGGSKKQVHILQKSPMFVTSSSSGKGEGKNQSLLANGPLTIEGKHFTLPSLIGLNMIIPSNLVCHVCNVLDVVAFYH